MTKNTRPNVAVLTDGREVDVRFVKRTDNGLVLGIVLWDGRFINIANVDPITWIS